jgi:hypothetical protein
MLTRPGFWIGFLGTSLLFAIAGCDVPTEYTVHSPECPWPPPRVSDSVGVLPLGCPWRTDEGVVVPGWPRL